MLIHELLGMLEENQDFEMEFVLNEDLGNFKGVQKQFLNAFKQYGIGKAGLNSKAGRNSPFNTVEAKTTADAIRKFEDPNVIGFVIQLNDKTQLLAVGKGVMNNDRLDKDDAYYVLDAAWLKAANPEAYKKAAKTLSGIHSTRDAHHVSFIKLHPIMTAIFKSAKENQKDPQIILISQDTERQAKKVERNAAKSGRVLTPKELKYMSAKEAKKFTDSFGRELKDRLDKYKSNKAIEAANPNEALKIFVEKGYLDKIKIDGYVYNLNSDRINFKGMKGDKWYGESYIEYTMDGNDPKYKETRTAQYAKARDMKSTGATEAEIEAEYDRARLAMPPMRIKVMLGLKGAAIVPTGEITFENY